MARRLMVLLLLTSLAGPARAGFDDGLAAFYDFNYAAALDEWIPLAEGGDSRAQYQLALMYYRGEGLPQDYEKAALWYRRAAERGDVDAQLNLGLMLAQGLGVKQSFFAAFKWFELAVINAPNSEFYDKAYFNRENAASMLDRKAIDKAERWAKDWHPKPQ
jgi:TPR repeat protein